ncbi:helix-turn-helix domain-containing protein [uncultured Serinicoccus sp.]|uniref:helix-turn-helix transcriptional regulator n=1 Tax=uncultured Serinicoccus sp. TaxID=735514 RepID=UPI002633CE72|nr:helix-turn-helix domain-containing protein [uncultured Serinicoccus sp.]
MVNITQVPDAMAEVHDESRTRDRVRRAVGERAPVTASALAKELGLTPAAVRRHLDALDEAGLIAEHDGPLPGRRGRGRPARAYVLTSLGQEQFRTSYDGVANAALHYLADRVGVAAVESFAEAQIAQLEQRLRASVDRAVADAGSDDLQTRTAALAKALSHEGYAASARPVGEGTGLAGLQLCQGHCPVREVATEFPQFCEAETKAIARILDVHVQRLATLAGGEHVCTTFVPIGALGTAPPSAEERASAPPFVIPRTPTPPDPTDRTADERT